MTRGKQRTAADVAQVLALNSTRTAEGCLEWTGPLTNRGYGRFAWKPDGYVIGGAHRIAAWLAQGPIAKGLVVDHLCENRRCIDPAHLRIVSGRENSIRSTVTLAAINSSKTHCAQGHEFSAENTYVWRHTKKSTTWRICRACRRARQQESRQRKESAA